MTCLMKIEGCSTGAGLKKKRGCASLGQRRVDESSLKWTREKGEGTSRLSKNHTGVLDRTTDNQAVRTTDWRLPGKSVIRICTKYFCWKEKRGRNYPTRNWSC